jgi:23S rRNA (adenine2503-C2)-methyltransferase
MTTDRINLYDLSAEGIADLLRTWGEPAYRARQLYEQLYRHRVGSFAEMTNLSKALRQRLETECRLGDLEERKLLIGDDGMTRKALWALPDGAPVETVLMIYPDRATVCISSQSGCPMQCVFCATGKLGFLHDLTSGQIIEQVMWAERTLRQVQGQVPGHPLTKLTNIVYMGMGEPFNNYDHFWTSVERLHDPAGYDMGARNFTVSTVGLIPGILRLADAPLPINLAISLHAADDALRSDMMPVNKRYPIADLIDATRTYTTKTRRRVSFEYVLLKEKNDTPEQAATLAALLRPPNQAPLLCHVNLIPWNPVPGTPLGRSDRQRVTAFQRVLQDAGIPCTVRVERGMDIAAACGQLAGA